MMIVSEDKRRGRSEGTVLFDLYILLCCYRNKANSLRIFYLGTPKYAVFDGGNIGYYYNREDDYGCVKWKSTARANALR